MQTTHISSLIAIAREHNRATAISLLKFDNPSVDNSHYVGMLTNDEQQLLLRNDPCFNGPQDETLEAYFRTRIMAEVHPFELRHIPAELQHATCIEDLASVVLWATSYGSFDIEEEPIIDFVENVMEWETEHGTDQDGKPFTAFTDPLGGEAVLFENYKFLTDSL